MKVYRHHGCGVNTRKLYLGGCNLLFDLMKGCLGRHSPLMIRPLYT